jgi:hypothetical protein
MIQADNLRQLALITFCWAIKNIHNHIRTPIKKTKKKSLSKEQNELKRQLGIQDNDLYRIDPASGKVQKEGFWGWRDKQ